MTAHTGYPGIAMAFKFLKFITNWVKIRQKSNAKSTRMKWLDHDIIGIVCKKISDYIVAIPDQIASVEAIQLVYICQWHRSAAAYWHELDWALEN